MLERLMAIAVLLGVAVTAYWLFALYLRDPARPNTVLLNVGAEALKFDSAYVRPDARASDVDGAVEIAAFFPDFDPAGRVDDITAQTALNARFERIVFISIKPAGGIDPSDRLAKLYQRFLEEKARKEPGGLIARAFQKGSPFEGDELHFNPPEGHEFIARCLGPDPGRKTPNSCIASFRSGGLDVDVRFSPGWLSQWTKVMTGARGLLESARRSDPSSR